MEGEAKEERLVLLKFLDCHPGFISRPRQTLETKSKLLNGHVRCLVRQFNDKQRGTLSLGAVNRA